MFIKLTRTLSQGASQLGECTTQRNTRAELRIASRRAFFLTSPHTLVVFLKLKRRQHSIRDDVFFIQQSIKAQRTEDVGQSSQGGNASYAGVIQGQVIAIFE